MSTAIVPAGNPKLLRHDRRSMFSDDVALRKQIQATHAYDERSIDTESILVIVKDIFNVVTPGIHNVSTFDFSFWYLVCLYFRYALSSCSSWPGLDESHRNPRWNGRIDQLWLRGRRISLSVEQDLHWGWSLISILLYVSFYLDIFDHLRFVRVQTIPHREIRKYATNI